MIGGYSSVRMRWNSANGAFESPGQGERMQSILLDTGRNLLPFRIARLDLRKATRGISVQAVLVMLFQTTSSPAPIPETRFDLSEADRRKTLSAPADPCRAADPNAIVVCGSRDTEEKYRYRNEPSRYDENGIPRAEIGLGGDVKGNVHVEQRGMPGGTISKRIMVTVTKPF
jgi:hypothetical protein